MKFFGLRVIRFFPAPTAFLLSAAMAYAQSTASLRGVIADPSGAVVPEAVVTLSNIQNGSKRSIISGATGEYSFLQVAPGAYKLVVDKPGFATMTSDNIQLLVNTPTTLDITMTVSSTGEKVNVTATASEVNTTDATVGNPFGERQVRQLPL